MSIYEDGRIVRTPDELAEAVAAIRKAQADRIGEHSRKSDYKVN